MFKNSISYFFLKKLIFSDRSGSLVRRITMLSFFGISLSLMAFFIVLFVMNGMNRNIKTRIMSIEPHLSVTEPTTQSAQVSKEELSVEEVVHKKNLILSEIKNRNALAINYQNFDLILRTYEGQFRGAEAVGFTTEGIKNWLGLLKTMRSKLVNRYDYEDEYFNFELGENEVAIGRDLAGMLGLLEGDELTLIPPETLLLSGLETPIFQKVVVKRLLETDLVDLDTKLLLFNSDNTLKNFKNTLSNKSGYDLWFDNVNEADVLQAKLSTENIQSQTWKEKNSDLFFALKMEKLMIGSFLTLAGLIASCSILAVLGLLMSQKRKDIAIIKTLGMSQRQTLWLFTKMGLWISLSAIALGSVLGISISLYLQNYPVNILPNIYYDSSIPAQVDFQFVAIVISISSLLAFLGAYIPAKATLNIQPALLLKEK